MQALVEDIRHFNRVWTRIIGLLDRGMLQTDLTLTEARVLYELAQQDLVERQRLLDDLGLDPSYLTRILRRFQREGWVRADRSTRDRRAVNLGLTDAGRAFFLTLDQRSTAEINALVANLSADEARQLGETLTVAANLATPRSMIDRVAIRAARPGDFGWIISRHGAVYHDMCGWSEVFEGKVARIVSDYLANHQTGREQAWIAEVDGARAGCILCCEREPGIAQLRVLLVETWARGMGLGHQLVETCLAFAEAAGYHQIVLETDASLLAALRIYQAAGFSLSTDAAPMVHGNPEDAQFWSLNLPRGRGGSAAIEQGMTTR